MKRVYLAEVEQSKAKPHVEGNKVYDSVCPFCGYVCKVEVLNRAYVETTYDKCLICRKHLVERRAL